MAITPIIMAPNCSKLIFIGSLPLWVSMFMPPLYLNWRSHVTGDNRCSSFHLSTKLALHICQKKLNLFFNCYHGCCKWDESQSLIGALTWEFQHFTLSICFPILEYVFPFRISLHVCLSLIYV